MQNVEVQRTGDKLVLTVDLSKNYGKSRSGKSTIIATTEGNVKVPETNGRTIKFGINVYEIEEARP